MTKLGSEETSDGLIRSELAKQTEDLISFQKDQEEESQRRTKMTPEQLKAEKVDGRISKKSWGLPTTDIEIAKTQAIMKRRSRDHRGVPLGAASMTGHVEEIEVEREEEE